MKNTLLGTWRLNVDKSMAEPGPLVRSESRVYETIASDGLRLRVQGVDASGNAYSYGATGRMDGSDCPLTGTGTRNGADSTSWKRIDAQTVDSKVKKAGEIVNHVMLEVSNDGKILTLREHGTNASGATTRGLRIYERL
jgi:hypothetical protein